MWYNVEKHVGVIPIYVSFEREDFRNLSVGEKLKLFRKANSMSQEELGKILSISSTQVNKVEGGYDEYTIEQVEAARKHFNIMDMPLSKHDCIAFKKRLYIWRDYIRDLRMVDAEEMHSKMSPIVNLDICDHDLPILYRLFEIMLLLYKNNLYAAEEKMKQLENFKDKMTYEHRHYHLCNKGLRDIFSEKYEDALEHYTQAFELRNQYASSAYKEDDERLYYGLAVCYAKLERLISASTALSKIYMMPARTRTEGFILNLDNICAINDMKLGKFTEAKELLEGCLILAKSMDNKHFVGTVLGNLGLLNKYLGNPEEAIEYFYKALNYFEVGSDIHIWTLYHKTHCFIDNGKFYQAEGVMRKLKELYSTHDDYSVIFNTLHFYMGIKKRTSQYTERFTGYIEEETIPFFIKKHDYFTALGYYETLEMCYEKMKNHEKSLLAAKGMRDIYKLIYR